MSPTSLEVGGVSLSVPAVMESVVEVAAAVVPNDVIAVSIVTPSPVVGVVAAAVVAGGGGVVVTMGTQTPPSLGRLSSWQTHRPLERLQTVFLLRQ